MRTRRDESNRRLEVEAAKLLAARAFVDTLREHGIVVAGCSFCTTHVPRRRSLACPVCSTVLGGGVRRVVRPEASPSLVGVTSMPGLSIRDRDLFDVLDAARREGAVRRELVRDDLVRALKIYLNGRYGRLSRDAESPPGGRRGGRAPGPRSGGRRGR